MELRTPRTLAVWKLHHSNNPTRPRTRMLLETADPCQFAPAEQVVCGRSCSLLRKSRGRQSGCRSCQDTAQDRTGRPLNRSHWRRHGRIHRCRQHEVLLPGLSSRPLHARQTPRQVPGVLYRGSQDRTGQTWCPLPRTRSESNRHRSGVAGLRSKPVITAG